MSTRLDDIHSELVEIKLTQKEIELNLKEHIRRTELAEESIQLIREEFKPIKKHVDTVNTTAKVISIFGALILFFKELGVIFL